MVRDREKMIVSCGCVTAPPAQQPTPSIPPPVGQGVYYLEYDPQRGMFRVRPGLPSAPQQGDIPTAPVISPAVSHGG